MKSIAQTVREIKANDPQIKANQIWVARSHRKIIRRLRILAQMPEPTGLSDEKQKVWIVEEKPSPMMHEIRIFKVPEFNLRYVFRLHKEV